MSDRAICRLQGVRKGYGGPFRLHVDALEVQAGEVACLLGPNGAGKSTLLRLLAGVERPDEGEVWLDGHRLDLPDVALAIRRRVTMVFQRPIMLAGTVRQNVEYGLRLRVRRCRRHVDELLGRLNLEDIAEQSARTTSGGQQQLVALVRALAVDPDVLLLDEPTAHLDPAHVALVEQAVAEEDRGRGMTVVWATQSVFQAHRAGLLLDGRRRDVLLAPALGRTQGIDRDMTRMRGATAGPWHRASSEGIPWKSIGRPDATGFR